MIRRASDWLNRYRGVPGSLTVRRFVRAQAPPPRMWAVLIHPLPIPRIGLRRPAQERSSTVFGSSQVCGVTSVSLIPHVEPEPVLRPQGRKSLFSNRRLGLQSELSCSQFDPRRGSLPTHSNLGGKNRF